MVLVQGGGRQLTIAPAGDMLWPLLVLGQVVVLVMSRPSYQGVLEPVKDEVWLTRVPELLQNGWIDVYTSDKYTDTDMPDPSKRALSMLSRWRPFSGFMSRYMQPRAPPANVLPDNSDLVSAETRGALRPLGQPLRWGRR
uniref:HanSolin n=1 Tax=Carausius morosus TaxID=7022 RepID=A0A8K1VRY9_CARMO|nr:HanSolin [Carausius morosus]